MLDIVPNYHRIQFQGKFMIQTHENAEKHHSEPKLGLPIFFYKSGSYTLIHAIILHIFKGKLKNQTWENGEKPNFGSEFGVFGLNLGPPKIFFRGFYLY